MGKSRFKLLTEIELQIIKHFDAIMELMNEAEKTGFFTVSGRETLHSEPFDVVDLDDFQRYVTGFSGTVSIEKNWEAIQKDKEGFVEYLAEQENKNHVLFNLIGIAKASRPIDGK